MRRRALLAAIQTESSIPNNEIWYTSSDGNVVAPKSTDVFGANLISNTCNYGIGVITFDGDVTMIGDDAFNNCNKLTGVTLPKSVTSIGKNAFNTCDDLTKFTIPDSVTSIGDWAFAYCRNLRSVTVGDSVTTIGNYAFHVCNELLSIYCMPVTPPTLGGTSVFAANDSRRKIYVPAGSVNAYKSATRWSEYASDIIGITN